MTWKRVATAAVLIPFVVGLVLLGSTAWVAVGPALVIVLALREYFGLGDAIGHRAYRFWTTACAMLLVYTQWVVTLQASYPLGWGLSYIARSRVLRAASARRKTFFRCSCWASPR